MSLLVIGCDQRRTLTSQGMDTKAVCDSCCCKVCHWTLFLAIKGKFWLNYYTPRCSIEAGLTTSAHSQGSVSGPGKHQVLEPEHTA